jgi:hypothetical protein
VPHEGQENVTHLLLRQDIPGIPIFLEIVKDFSMCDDGETINGLV